MEFSNKSRQSLIPNFLYSSSASTKRLVDLDNLAPNQNSASQISSSPYASLPERGVTMSSSSKRKLVIEAPSESGKVAMYSPAYYAICTVSGCLSTGLTHMAVTPMDVVKCNMQVPLSISHFSLSLSLSLSLNIYIYIFTVFSP